MFLKIVLLEIKTDKLENRSHVIQWFDHDLGIKLFWLRYEKTCEDF